MCPSDYRHLTPKPSPTNSPNLTLTQALTQPIKWMAILNLQRERQRLKLEAKQAVEEHRRTLAQVSQ